MTTRLYTYMSMILLLVILVYVPLAATGDSVWMSYEEDRFVFGGVGKQVAVIFWQDGYELLLVASSYESGGNATGVYLFPLPSKPIVYGVYSVSGAFSVDAEVVYYKRDLWRRFIYAAYSGLAGEGSGGIRVLAEIRGPGVNVSLVEAHDMDRGSLEEYVASLAPGASLPEGMDDVLNYYSARGWRYLVVGGVSVPRGGGTIVSLYVFRSDEIVYPLYIDKGIPGPSRVEVIVVSNHPVASVDSGVDGVSLSPRWYRAARSGSSLVLDAGEASPGIYHGLSEAAGLFDQVIEQVGEGGVYVFFTGYMYSYNYTAEPRGICGDMVMRPGSDLTIYALDMMDGGVVPLYVPFLLLFLPTPFLPAGLIVFLVSLYGVYAGRKRFWFVEEGAASYLYALLLIIYVIPAAVLLYRYMGSVEGLPYVYAYMDMAIPLVFIASIKPVLVYAMLLHASSVDRSEYMAAAALSLLEPVLLAATQFSVAGVAAALAVSLAVLCYVSYRVFARWERSRFEYPLLALAALPVAVYLANLLVPVLHVYAVYPALLYGIGSAVSAATVMAVYGFYGRVSIDFTEIPGGEPLEEETVVF